MRIAVTGAAGYIGGWLLPELKARGHHVHAQDLNGPGTITAWDAWHDFNLLDGGHRAAWLRDCRPDAVIHLAALYGRVWGEQDLAETARANAGLTAALARDTAAAGARLMLASSSEVYGASADQGAVTPGSPLRPRNMYGLSKKWAEEAAALYAPRGLMACRLNMPYGPARNPPPPGTAPATSGRAGPLGYNVLHTMAWQASHGMDITVHKGTTRCLTWAGDTARGLAVILESGHAGTWNVCRDDDHRPVAELARRAVELAGSASRIREEPPPPRVTLRKPLDNTGLLALGWEPAVGLDEGMKHTLAWYSRFGPDGRWHG